MAAQKSTQPSTEGGVGNVLKLNDAIPFIEAHINSHVSEKAERGELRRSVLYISGPPGIGKSDVMETICRRLSSGLCVYYLATLQIEQWTGLPMAGSASEKGFHRWFSNAVHCLKTTATANPILSGLSEVLPEYKVEEEPPYTRWSLPELFTFRNIRVKSKDLDNDTMVLFLDDAHLVNKTMQSYLFQLLTYRSINSHKLPGNVVMIMAGNRSTDHAGFQQMLAPITNRVYFLDVTGDVDDWTRNFAMDNFVRTDMIMFLQNNPECLSGTPLENQPWPSPRSWTYASTELNNFETYHKRLDINHIYTILKGHVGPEYASKFVTYKTLMMRWNAPAILEGREKIAYKDLNQIELYSLMSVVIDEMLKRMRHKSYKLDSADTTYIDNLKLVLENVTKLCRPIVPLGLKILVLGDKGSEKGLLARKLLDSSSVLPTINEIV